MTTGARSTRGHCARATLPLRYSGARCNNETGPTHQTFRVAAKHSRGMMPLVAQVGAPSTEETVIIAKEAEAAGVAALGCVTPYYVTPDDESMLTHFKAVLGSVKLPVYIYNIPRSAVNNVSPELMMRLVEAGIARVKNSSRDFVQVMEYLQVLPATSTVICGTDSYILPALLMRARCLGSTV